MWKHSAPYVRHALLACACLMPAVGCTRFVEVDRSSYPDLVSEEGRRYRIRTTSQITYETKKFTVRDSVIVIESITNRASVFSPGDAPPHDTKLPVEVPFSEAVAIKRLSKDWEYGPRWAFVETGIMAGGTSRSGVEEFSRALLNLEGGYLRGARYGDKEGSWGFGGTLSLTQGEHDTWLAIKPRVRYRFHEDWSTDVTAGLIFGSWSNREEIRNRGFIGGLSLAYLGMLTFTTDVVVRPYDAFRTYNEKAQAQVTTPAGTELSWYGGIALRGRSGWIATGVGAVLVLSIYAIFLAAFASGMGRAD